MAGRPGADFLIGGGQMADLIASTDWARTCLGPMEDWPQSLKTATSLVLGSKFAMVVAWGPEFVFLYNDRYRPVLGGKHPAALGRPGAEIFPEVWDDIVGPLFRRAITEEAIALDDILIPLDRNGFLEECYFTLSYSPIRGESGAVGGLLAVVAESTERVQSERGMRTLRDLAAAAGRAKSQEQALRDAAAVLAANPTDVPFASCYLVDARGAEARRVDGFGVEPGCSAAPERIALDDATAPWLFARDAQQPVIVESLDELGTLPGGAFPEPCRAAVILPITRPGAPHPFGFVVAGTCPRRAVDERYRTFFELAGEHIATGVSNARAYEQEQRRAEELAALDRAKTAFFSNISHEFRTPLTLMLGPTEDALASPSRALSGEQLESVYRNELRLLKLVNALLDFARIEAGRVEVCYRPTDLPRLTTELASAFQSAIERVGLVLEVDCPAIEEPVWVDPAMWEKIVLNLLSNALKFTFEGTIRVELRAKDAAVTLRISDSGTGIPEEELPRLFERFHRVQGARSRTHEGSGIGLALVQELARRHGGHVRVESRLGHGTTFEVAIPCGNAHLPPERLEAAPALVSTSLGAPAFIAEAQRWSVDDVAAPPGSPPPSGPRSRVLVVDDNADMRDYLRRLLSERHDVVTATDGEAALRIREQARPDLVVADVMMPGLDGLGLVRELRRDDDARRIPVILLSTRAGDESRVEGLQAGADDYLVKPFSARELLARVETQLALARLRRSTERERSALTEQVRFTETLNRVGRALNTGLELQHVLQLFTDEATALCSASFGAFFYNLVGKDGESYMLYTLSGVPREAFAGFPLPRNTQVFEPTFRGTAVVRSDDITRDPRYGHSAPYHGMPSGHLPVRSYLALPVRDPRGEVLGGLFFGHREPGMFTAQHEELLVAVAAQAATAIQNARLYEDARAARREAESASRAKDEFFAILGHELRNPLTPIKMALHLIAEQKPEKISHELEVIERQVEHMVRLVDDLLDVSRIAAGKVELRKQPLELAGAIGTALEAASSLFEQRQHRVHLDAPAGLVVDADPVRLAQVITNLLTNAAKYTPQGGEVSIVARADADHVELLVRDNGIGIAPEMLPRVFELFAQERQSFERSEGGLGLGLAIVRSLVTLHGGTVTAHSEGRGRGTAITIRLPRYSAAAAILPAQPIRELLSRDARGLRVLVVDDNVDAAELLAELLRRMGYETAVAFDGLEALRIARSFRPQIALLDIGLPVMDGYELARRLAEHEHERPALMVAISGYGLEADRQRSKQVGFAEHMVKPIQLTTLREILARVGTAGGT